MMCPTVYATYFDSFLLGDEIRRLVTESFIPFITEKLKQYRTRDHVKAIKEKTGERPTSLQVISMYLLVVILMY